MLNYEYLQYQFKIKRKIFGGEFNLHHFLCQGISNKT